MSDNGIDHEVPEGIIISPDQARPGDEVRLEYGDGNYITGVAEIAHTGGDLDGLMVVNGDLIHGDGYDPEFNGGRRRVVLLRRAAEVLLDEVVQRHHSTVEPGPDQAADTLRDIRRQLAEAGYTGSGPVASLLATALGDLTHEREQNRRGSPEVLSTVRTLLQEKGYRGGVVADAVRAALRDLDASQGKTRQFEAVLRQAADVLEGHLGHEVQGLAEALTEVIAQARKAGQVPVDYQQRIARIVALYMPVVDQGMGDPSVQLCKALGREVGAWRVGAAKAAQAASEPTREDAAATREALNEFARGIHKDVTRALDTIASVLYGKGK